MVHELSQVWSSMDVPVWVAGLAALVCTLSVVAAFRSLVGPSDAVAQRLQRNRSTRSPDNFWAYRVTEVHD